MSSKTSSETRKDQLINEIRRKYENKFGDSSEIKGALQNELLRLQLKPKLSLYDLEDLESKISTTSKCSPSPMTSSRNYGKHPKDQSTRDLPSLRNVSPQKNPYFMDSFTLNDSRAEIERNIVKGDNVRSPIIGASHNKTLSTDDRSRALLLGDESNNYRDFARYKELSLGLGDRVNTDKTEAYVNLLFK